MITASEENFTQETATGVVLVDFYADWCGPCRMLTATLQKITGAKIVKVNTDVCPNLATEHNVTAIPKLLFMKDGKVIDQITGLASQEVIQNKVNALAN